MYSEKDLYQVLFLNDVNKANKKHFKEIKYIMIKFIHLYVATTKDVSATVTPRQAYAHRFHKWIVYLKNESVGRCLNQYQIHICTPAWKMSSEFFTT